MAGVRLGGLWLNTGANGEQYWEGPFGSQSIIRIYENKYKKTEKEPVAVMYISQKMEDGKRPFKPAVKPKPKITPAPGYVDHTIPKDEAPWPESEHAPETGRMPWDE